MVAAGAELGEDAGEEDGDQDGGGGGVAEGEGFGEEVAGGFAEVLEGLVTGDEVILRAGAFLNDGDAVDPRRATPAASAGRSPYSRICKRVMPLWAGSVPAWTCPSTM